MTAPFFSIVIPTYDRAEIIGRCLDSCFDQSFSDFDVVVVDDASTDATVATLKGIDDPRLRIVEHEVNRGISPSRHTGVAASHGQWIVPVDSDWELFPYTLERLRDAIAELPDGVRVLRGPMLWDDGRVTPESPPTGVVGYEARVRGLEMGGDAVQCLQRAVFDTTPYFSDRRGTVESLYELELARAETSIWVPEVLGKEYTDARNSSVRSVDAGTIPRLLNEAPDMLWMAETALNEHGPALADYAPTLQRVFVRMGSTQAFLAGDRRKGLRYGLAALRLKKLNPAVWVGIALGLIGPRAVARGLLAHRWLGRLRASAESRRH
jgi:glycosyltransferase involved in cell wall biosynthesis